MPFKTELSVRFVGTDQAELIRPLVYVHPVYSEITVKAGFRTDFASVPGWVLLPCIVPRDGRIRWAAVVHDWIYRGHEWRRFTRAQADRILYDAAIECGLPRWRAWVAWDGVRLGGWSVWAGS